MKKAKIFSFVKISPNSMVASVRITRFVSDLLQIPIHTDESIGDAPLDILVIVNGAFAFTPPTVLASLGKAIEEADKIIWIQNDYTIVPPKDTGNAESPFRKAFRNRKSAGKSPPDYWTTCKEYSVPGSRSSSGHPLGEGSAYVNWNCLTLEELPFKPFSDRPCKDAMLYYGSYRVNREKYFNRYFTTPEVPIIVSSPSKKFDQFKNIIRVDKLQKETIVISDFGMGLYIEDENSHRNFHSPANRLYEMLSAGLPIVFQPEAESQLREAGFDINAWTIRSRPSSTLFELFERREEIAQTQKAMLWHLAASARALLPERVVGLWRNYL